MWDFKLANVFGLMGKTLPFLIFRFLIFFAITLIAIAVTGGGAGIGWVAGQVLGDPGTGAGYGGLIGAGVVGAGLYFIREYLLYQVKAGHIAVLVHLLDGKPVPEGRGMVDYAKDQVKEYFKESSVLFGVDQLITGVLKTVNRTFNTIANFIPIPGLQGAVKFFNSIVNMSLTYVDEVLLAYYMKQVDAGAEKNPWEHSRHALVLYGQNYKNLLKNAFWLTIFIWILTFIVFLLILGPVALLVAAVPALAGFWTFAFAALFAWGIKAALIDPIAMTALMQVYFKAIEGQQPNPEWDQKLDKMSGKFRELKSKAAAWISGDRPKAAEPAPSIAD